MKAEKNEKPSFGAGEFIVQCRPTDVRLIIHGTEIIARNEEDVYSELFAYCLNRLGGRIGKQYIPTPPPKAIKK